MKEARPKKRKKKQPIQAVYIKIPTHYKLIHTSRADQQLPQMGGLEGSETQRSKRKGLSPEEHKETSRGWSTCLSPWLPWWLNGSIQMPCLSNSTLKYVQFIVHHLSLNKSVKKFLWVKNFWVSQQVRSVQHNSMALGCFRSQNTWLLTWKSPNSLMKATGSCHTVLSSSSRTRSVAPCSHLFLQTFTGKSLVTSLCVGLCSSWKTLADTASTFYYWGDHITYCPNQDTSTNINWDCSRQAVEVGGYGWFPNTPSALSPSSFQPQSHSTI